MSMNFEENTMSCDTCGEEILYETVFYTDGHKHYCSEKCSQNDENLETEMFGGFAPFDFREDEDSDEDYDQEQAFKMDDELQERLDQYFTVEGCEYCNSESDNTLLPFELVGGPEGWEIEMSLFDPDEGFILNILNDNINKVIELELSIKYCPNCGRSLSPLIQVGNECATDNPHNLNENMLSPDVEKLGYRLCSHYQDYYLHKSREEHELLHRAWIYKNDVTGDEAILIDPLDGYPGFFRMVSEDDIEINHEFIDEAMGRSILYGYDAAIPGSFIFYDSNNKNFTAIDNEGSDTYSNDFDNFYDAAAWLLYKSVY